MGSFISCTSASKSHSPPPRTPVMPHVARVLLVDGSVIHFTRPVKVIRLLLDHPDHFICPLDSLRPGHHSLSSLLPDEELQLGHLYLLLPFQTFEKRRDGVAKNHGEGRMLHGAHNGNNNIVQREPARDAEAPKRGGDGAARLLARDKSGDLRTSAKHKGPVPHVGHLSHSSTSSPAQASNYNHNALHERRSASHASSSYMNIRSSSTRLCDTPELQKAYRSDMLRRCRTWTPRLQAITETRNYIGAAGNNS